MKKAYLLAALIALGLGVMGLAAQPVQASTSPSTQSFVQAATIDNNFEIQAAQVALRNSSNDEIKGFAQKLLDEHTQIASQMKTAMASANVAAPPANTQKIAATSPLDPKHRKILDQLNKTSGDAFDDMYVKTQVDAHNADVRLYSDYAKSGDNPTLKQFAAQQLPTLQQQQKDAEEFKESF